MRALPFNLIVPFTFFIACLFTFPFSLTSQELFPNTESASNLPKGVLRVKLSNEEFQEISQIRLWQGYSFNYGISSKLSIDQTLSLSNHHDLNLPPNFIYYNPATNQLQTNGYIRGQVHPFWLENYCATLKYRFLNLDGQASHFRMAGYFQFAGGNEAHLESEPDLMGDNSGVASGLIATWLKNKFAVSANLGYIIPFSFQQIDSAIKIRYSNALTYSLSLGYALLPLHYHSYKQVNMNLYLEFMGESFDAAQISKKGEPVYSANIPSLGKQSYLEARPGLQFIFGSNTRLSFSPAFKLFNYSYAKTYPVYYVYLQHDFFF